LAVLPLGCSDGDDGAPGPAGPPGPPGPNAINASTSSNEFLAQLDVTSEVLAVTIQSPPVVTFKVSTADGLPIVGLVPFWEEDERFIRFTITKLVPGQNGDPDRWVAYVRDGGEPDYDTGASVVDNNDGTYSFTFNTDVANVSGVTYEPALTHRVAGQIGNLGLVPLEEQNLWLDFVPNGTALTTTRNIAVVASCNECHDRLVFHGRRFEVEYCVQCHNPDLAEGEGDMSFMVHRIHNAGTFHVLDGGISYAEVTYPQSVLHCRKCHNIDDTATPQGNNWREKPNISACNGCHDIFGPNAANTHSGGPQTNNTDCANCHTAAAITDYHTTTNATPNNPELPPGQRNITYEMVDASVDGSNVVTARFKILSDGVPLDPTSLGALPADVKNPTTGYAYNTPALLVAWALPQDGVTTMVDYNNRGQSAAQPRSLSLCQTSGTQTGFTPHGTLAFNPADGVVTATITTAGSQFPVGAQLRAVALQGYFMQDLTGDGVADVSLHTISVWAPVTGDDVRREVVDSAKCANCHEWFEGHGGNRVYTVAVCVMCHVPNLSSSGRTIATNPPATPTEPWPANPLQNPEDSQNMKDMIHGIHASAFRSRDFVHVRNRLSGFWYNWSEVTFPAETNNCLLCHKEGTYTLPLADGVLATTVRTTGVADGQDPSQAAVTTARGGAALPNATDWVNTPAASSCFYCHTSQTSWAHMVQNGALLSVPDSQPYTNRSVLGSTFESCAVCHGPGKTADVMVVHSR
jgi:OmcA/MtrC family decaheme c-type cytochrome